MHLKCAIEGISPVSLDTEGADMRGMYTATQLNRRNNLLLLPILFCRRGSTTRLLTVEYGIKTSGELDTILVLFFRLQSRETIQASPMFTDNTRNGLERAGTPVSHSASVAAPGCRA